MPAESQRTRRPPHTRTLSRAVASRPIEEHGRCGDKRAGTRDGRNPARRRTPVLGGEGLSRLQSGRCRSSRAGCTFPGHGAASHQSRLAAIPATASPPRRPDGRAAAASPQRTDGRLRLGEGKIRGKHAASAEWKDGGDTSFWMTASSHDDSTARYGDQGSGEEGSPALARAEARARSESGPGVTCAPRSESPAAPSPPPVIPVPDRPPNGFGVEPVPGSLVLFADLSAKAACAPRVRTRTPWGRSSRTGIRTGPHPRGAMPSASWGRATLRTVCCPDDGQLVQRVSPASRRGCHRCASIGSRSGSPRSLLSSP